MVPKKEYIKSSLQKIYNIPTFPVIINEINKLFDNPMASAAQLGEIINKDQGLVTKILSVANSPFYGISRRVSTIQFAIVILGFQQIKNIVVALSLMESFNRVESQYFNQKKYWQHSLMTATAAKKISEDLGFLNSGEAFTAGLIHDLGIPILCKHFPKEFAEIHLTAHEKKISFLEAEDEVIGISHQEIAAFLIDKWNLPLPLLDAAKNHHKPSNSENNKRLTAIVHLTDFMTDKLSTGNFNWDTDYDFDPEVINILNLGDANYLENFVNTYRDIFRDQFASINNI